MRPMLLVTAGPDHAREVFRREGRVAWSEALEVVLEKHGILEVGRAGPEALAGDPGAAVVLVARLPDEAWRGVDVERLAAGSSQLLLEGPVPAAVLDAVGATSHGRIERTGGIVAVDPGLRRAAERYGVPLGAALAPPERRPVARDEGLHWQAAPEPRIAPRQAGAWAARGWEVEHLTVAPETTVLGQWVDLEDATHRFEAIVRRGALTVCGFGLFAFLAQRHTSEPFGPGERLVTNRSAGLEAMLLGLVDQLHARAGVVRARVLPWPRAAPWARVVRHDVDRTLPAGRLRRLLAAHDAAGTRATLTVAPSAADAAGEALRAAAGAHDVALAVERGPLDARAELADVARRVGRPVIGAVWPGHARAFGFQGAPSLLWAAEAGLRWAEMLEHAHFVPHRFVGVAPDGQAQPVDLLCMPFPERLSLARRMDTGRIAESEERWRSAGGLHTVILPPMPGGGLDRLLHRHLRPVTGDDALTLTASEAADWWRRTHVRDALRVRRTPGGDVEVTSAAGVEGLAVELLQPDGARRVEVLDLAEGESRTLDVRVAPSTLPSVWEDVNEAYADAVRRTAEPGADPGRLAASVNNTTAAIPGRGEFLLDLIRTLAAVDPAGRRILDVGTGFGSLLAYVAWRGGAAHAVGIDASERYVAEARRAAAATGLDALVAFERGSMEDLGAFADGAFDLVLFNGVLMYARSRAGLRATLREAARVLAPGGRLVVYHRNRWRLDEPEHGGRPLQLLPRALQPRLAPPGRRPKRWLSPLELRRAVRAAGLRDVRIAGWTGSVRRDRGPRRLLGESYALAATRPKDRR